MENNFIGKKYEISFIQNFICTKKDRLDMISENIPHFAEIINPYPVLVNYDTDIYYEEVKEIYEKNIENLHFQKKLNSDWAGVTDELLEMTDSPYVAYLTEDVFFHPEFGRDDFQKLFEEYKSNNCKHMWMGKVDKYRRIKEHTNSKKGEYLWHFHSSKSPNMWTNNGRGCLSLVSLNERNLFKECLSKAIGGGGAFSGIDLYERSNHIADVDIMCSVPNQSFFTELHPGEGTTERGGNKPTGFTDIV